MSLQGCRVLVVEDNYLVAEQMASFLGKAGAAVCGPFTTNAKALPLAVSEKLHGAVLDVRLVDGTSAPVAQALRRRYVPFVVVSGYGSACIPRGMRKAPFLAKPILGDELIALAARRFRLPDNGSAPEATTELLDLAYRVRMELLALTGKSGVAVLVDILPKRLRTPPYMIDHALLLAERNGWLIRKGQSVRLTELGRSTIPFPETPSSEDDAGGAVDE